LEAGRRDGGLAIEKRERRDGGFGMEMMERRGGGFAMEKRERRDVGFGMEMMERRGFPAFRSLTGGPRAWWDPCVSVSMAGWATSGDPCQRREEVVLQWRRGRGEPVVLEWR